MTIKSHASTSFSVTIATGQLPKGYRFTTFGLTVDVLDGSGAAIGNRESFLPKSVPVVLLRAWR